MPINAFKAHTYITGRTGTGKSELMKYLFYELQKYSQDKWIYSLMLLDPHGDLAEEILRFKLNAIQEDRILYIAPEPRQSPVLNPLQLPLSLSAKEKEELIPLFSVELARIFQEMMGGTSQLSLQMEALLIPCVSTLLRKGDSSLSELQRFMDDKENQDLVKLGQKSPHPNHRIFFQTAFVENSSYRLTKQSIYTKIQSLLNSPIFYHFTEGKSSVDLEEVLNTGKVVLFNLAQGKMGTEVSNLLGRFILAYVQSLVLRRVYQAKSSRKPSFIFIDECQNYLSKTMGAILAEARKYGLFLVLANQHLGQIQEKSLKEGVLSNTGIKFLGANTANTSKVLAKEVGLKADALTSLAPYYFYLSHQNKIPQLFKPPKFLHKKPKKYLLSLKELKDLKEKIRNKYYQPIQKQTQENIKQKMPQPKYPINNGMIQ